MKFLPWKGLLALLVVGVSPSAMAAPVVTAPDVPSASPSRILAAVPSDKQDSKPDQKENPLHLTVDTLPLQYAFVSGDTHKFEALNWQNAGYSGGVKDFSLQYKTADDIDVDMNGHAIAGNGDYKGSATMTKKDFGYLKFNYKQFRKYYDTLGGVFHSFNEMSSNGLDRDLFLDIGTFSIEAGLTRPDFPNVTVYYEHRYKDGSKSTLNWAEVRVKTVRKNIAPSWKEIDEDADTFGIKAEHTLKSGYRLTGDQRMEIVRAKTRGYEQKISDDPAGANRNRVIQDRVPETNLMTTTLGADKRYLKDKVFVSTAYRYEHLRNQERQDINEYKNSAPYPTGTNRPNGSAHNNLDLNSWVMNTMVSPWTWLSGTARFKSELLSQDSKSYYPNDAGLDGVIDNTSRSDNTSETFKFGEDFGIRFKAIPRTALYSELAFEQSHNRLIQKRDSLAGTSLSTGDIANRDAIILEPASTWTTGADFMPCRFANFTSQIRLRSQDMDFNDDPAVNPTVLMILDKVHSRSAGFNQRVTLRWASWAQTSFRYLYDNTDYTSRGAFAAQDDKANVLSHSFIYDVSLFPLPNLSMTASLSKHLAATKTVTDSVDPPHIPAFTSNYYTWMFNTDYLIHPKVHLTGNLFHTASHNFNDLTSGIPLGADFDETGLTAGLKWDIRKDLSIQPKYSLSRYAPNKDADAGGYTAHIMSIEITALWG